MAYHMLADGSISSPSGFRATGIHAGLKPNQARDLALLYSLQPCTAAALFTTSTIKGAPVLLNQAILARNRERLRAVLINSGIANVGLGRAGLEAAAECVGLAADELQLPRDSVLMLSTGAVGVPLPLELLRAGIRRAAAELDGAGGHHAALAMLSEDQQPKELALSVRQRSGQELTLAGMAKGGRRVHPNLATLLCVVTSDARIPAPLLARSLREATSRSFHCISLDGEISPNDMILVLANGAADTTPISDVASWEFGAWQEALSELMHQLARKVVEDHPAGSMLIQLEITAARSDAEARLAGMALSRSPGVRQAWQRGTLSWEAIVAALGASGVEVAAEQLSLYLGEQALVLNGTVQPRALAALPAWPTQQEIRLRLALNLGPGQATIWTCS